MSKHNYVYCHVHYQQLEALCVYIRIGYSTCIYRGVDMEIYTSHGRIVKGITLALF